MAKDNDKTPREAVSDKDAAAMNSANGRVRAGTRNLKPITDSERARELQAKGAISRKKNAALRRQEEEERRIRIESMKNLVDNFMESSELLDENSPTGLKVLKISMLQAIAEGDRDEATRLAAIIAEYEQPKLQRVDQTSKVMDLSNLSDEELEKMIRGEDSE